MPVHVMVRAEPGVCKPPPFAQLPHDIAADPRLTPVDTRVLLALLFWARDKAACWPCDRSIAARVGRSVSTVQRALRRLQALGLVQREQVPQSDANRTGRVLRLRWRIDRPPGHSCYAPRSLAIGPPQSLVTDEGKIEGERERPESGPGPESPSPTAEDLELWRGWATGSNATLARFGRLALAQAGEVHVEPKVPPCPASLPASLPASPDPRNPAREIGAIPGANQVDHGVPLGPRAHAGLHPEPGGRGVSAESPEVAVGGEVTTHGCVPSNVHVGTRVSLSGDIRTIGTGGQTIFPVAAVLAEFERAVASGRTRVSQAYKRGKGEKTGGCAP